jgi:plastocyanin
MSKPCASWLPSGRFSIAALGALAMMTGLACKKNEPPGEPVAASSPTAGAAIGTAAAASNAPGALGKGIIQGSVHFTGKASTPDPFCARQAIKEEDLVVGAGGGLKNVLVRVTSGAAGNYEAPKTEATVDQNGCMYRPRVQAVMAGQTVLIKNSDQTLHNVHTYKGASTMFNQAQIPGMGPMSKTFADGGQVIKFKCDVHPWMTGYVAVATNPFFAVSGADGTFTIDKLPAGTYTLEAWHERLGTRTAQVTVSETAPVKAAFDFAGS